jgi:murein DD-endopeptidase MepM/ murein hydrolase activator NlpD
MKDIVKNLKLSLHPKGDVTQWFGENKALYAPMGLAGHNGIDIVRPWGEHMFAIEDAIVAEVKHDAGGYGKHIRLISADYKRMWTYGHCSEIIVNTGDKVYAGQHIANMGNTGFVVSNATGNGFWRSNPYAGTHVHFGLRLIQLDKKGWTYKGSGIPKFNVLNYGNGFKGSIDPVPVMTKAKLMSSRLEAIGTPAAIALAATLKKLGK